MEIISEEELKQINEQGERLGTRYEELFSFVCDLRQSDFKISAPQFIAIQKLIVALAGNGESVVDFGRLKTYLAPLVCSSPEDQSHFYQSFEKWLESHQPPAPIEQSAENNINDQPDEEILRTKDKKMIRLHWWQKPAFAAAGLSILILIALALILFYPSSVRTFSGSVHNIKTKQPVANAEIIVGNKTYLSNEAGEFSFEYQISSNSQPITVRRADYETINKTIEPEDKNGEFSLTPITPTATSTPVGEVVLQVPTPSPSPTFYQKYYFYILISAAVFPFIIYGLWLLQLWRKRRQLERWRDKNQPDFKNLTLEKDKSFLYSSSSFRRTVQELRRHRRVQTNALNIAHTVEATVREGGLFNPVLGTRQISPEYLILIDRLGFGDQKSRLEEEILDSFKHEGIFFDCFYFNGDPRLCRPQNTSRNGDVPKYFNLQELSMLYPEHRLLIFSDGDGMVDKFSNHPHRWVKLLSRWEIRALLTPNSAITFHEWLLEQEAGLPVLPAHEADLKTLIEVIDTGNVSKIKRYAANTNYPATLLENFNQWWLRRTSPHRESLSEDDAAEADDKIEMLCFELRYYLGKDGYFLLCACAAYPELVADLTFYLAHRFIVPAEREAILEALVCLPWFRQSVMPDWFREKLLEDLSLEQKTEVRQAIEQLLINYLENPQKGFNLEIATEKKETEEGFWKRWRQHKFLHDIIKTESEDSSLKDHVFLKFISASKLAVALPQKLSRFLQSKSNSRFAFLSRFYKACTAVIKAAGTLWQKIYRRNLPIAGISKTKGFLFPVFVSVIAVGILLLNPPVFPAVDPDDVSVVQDDLPPTNSSEEKPVVANVASPTQTPPASKCNVGKCCNNLTAADGYLITSISNGAQGSDLTMEYPIGPTFGKTTVYSPEIAKNIGDYVLQRYYSEGMRSVTGICPQILPPSDDCPGGKCVSLNVYLSSETTGTESVNITVYVTDEDTKEAITNGSIYYISNVSATQSVLVLNGNPTNDSIVLETGTTYTVTISAPGYVSDTQTITIDKDAKFISITLKKMDEPSPRVYLQIANENQKDRARKIELILEADNSYKFIVPGIDNVGSNSPKVTEVRYFREADQNEANAVAVILRDNDINVTLDFEPRLWNSNTMRPGHLEVWFAADAFPETK